MHTMHMHPQNQIFFFFFTIENYSIETQGIGLCGGIPSASTGSELSAACSPSEINAAVLGCVHTHQISPWVGYAFSTNGTSAELLSRG